MSTITKTSIACGVLLALSALLFLMAQSRPVSGAAPDGERAAVATSSVSQSVTAGAVELLFATSSQCAARIVSTNAGEVKLTFSDHNGVRPTALAGFGQPASSTVAYDASVYGCGAVYVFPSYTGVLNVAETVW